MAPAKEIFKRVTIHVCYYATISSYYYATISLCYIMHATISLCYYAILFCVIMPQFFVLLLFHNFLYYYYATISFCYYAINSVLFATISFFYYRYHVFFLMNSINIKIFFFSSSVLYIYL